MVWHAAAVLVVVLHLAFVVFVWVGGFLAWRWPILLRAHLAAFGIAVVIAVAGWECPLTGVEKTLRRWAGDSVYEGGFIDHYLVTPIFPDGTTPTLRLVTRGLLLATVAVAWLVVWQRHRFRMTQLALDSSLSSERHAAATLASTFGADPDAHSPSRDEWDRG